MEQPGPASPGWSNVKSVAFDFVDSKMVIVLEDKEYGTKGAILTTVTDVLACLANHSSFASFTVRAHLLAFLLTFADHSA